MYKIAVKKPDSTMEEKDIVLLSNSEYNSLVSFTSNMAKVAGMKKILSKLKLAQLSTGIYIPNEGLVVGDTGIFTRGICGITIPGANGDCSSDILRLNYLGENNYSRPVVLGAGSAGKGITGGAHQYAAVRGDQMVAYVTNAIQGKANKSDIPTIPEVSQASITRVLGLGTANNATDWGTITAGNGYSVLWGMDNPGGGGISIGEKYGQASMQIDGTFRQREGMYEVIDTSTIGSQHVAYADTATSASFANVMKSSPGQYQQMASNASNRPANWDEINAVCYNGIRAQLVSSSLGDKTEPDGTIMTFGWDMGNWDTQLIIPGGDSTGKVYNPMLRTQSGTQTYGSWHYIPYMEDVDKKITKEALTSVLGFGGYQPTITWGSMTSGYTPVWGSDNPNGGGIHFAEKDGQTSMQIDGDYYGDEGMRRLAYADEIPDISGKADKSSLATVATSGSYNDLNNKPTIPTKVSALENDKGYKTLDDIIDMGFAKSSTLANTYATKTELENKINGYVKNMTRIWQNGTAGISVGSTKNVNINNLRPAGASIHDTIIATSKDTSRRGTFCTTYYEVTDIDTNGYATLQSIGNYYSYDLPSNGTKLCTINGTNIEMGHSMTINASPASGTKLGTINGTAFNMGGSLSLSIPTPGFKHILTFDNTTQSYGFSSGNRILIVTPYDSHTLTIYSSSGTQLFSTTSIMTTVHYTSWKLYYGNVATGDVSTSSSYTSIRIECSGPCMVYVMDW